MHPPLIAFSVCDDCNLVKYDHVGSPYESPPQFIDVTGKDHRSV